MLGPFALGDLELPIRCPDVLGLIRHSPYFRFTPGKDPVLFAQALASRFEMQFGEKPVGIYVVGSHAEGFAEATSDIDVYFEGSAKLKARLPGLVKYEGPGFQFFRALNPGRVPDGVVGLGLGPGQAMLSDGKGSTIKKAGILDPFFGFEPPFSTAEQPAKKIWP